MADPLEGHDDLVGVRGGDDAGAGAASRSLAETAELTIAPSSPSSVIDASWSCISAMSGDTTTVGPSIDTPASW